MSSSLEFKNYLCEQIKLSGIKTRRMFGEYCIYYNGKVVGFICDDQFFIKKGEKTNEMFPDLIDSQPFQGAKNFMLVDNIDDDEYLSNLIQYTYSVLPEAKIKKKGKKYI